MKGLRQLAEEDICKRYILISQDRIPRKEGKIEIFYWQDFLELLWDDKIVF